MTCEPYTLLYKCIFTLYKLLYLGYFDEHPKLQSVPWPSVFRFSKIFNINIQGSTILQFFCVIKFKNNSTVSQDFFKSMESRPSFTLMKDVDKFLTNTLNSRGKALLNARSQVKIIYLQWCFPVDNIIHENSENHASFEENVFDFADHKLVFCAETYNVSGGR